MDIFAAVCELTGAYLVGIKKRLAFIVNIVGCLAWIYVAFTKDVYGLFVVCSIAIVINIKNYIGWKHETKSTIKRLQCH